MPTRYTPITPPPPPSSEGAFFCTSNKQPNTPTRRGVGREQIGGKKKKKNKGRLGEGILETICRNKSPSSTIEKSFAPGFSFGYVRLPLFLIVVRGRTCCREDCYHAAITSTLKSSSHGRNQDQGGKNAKGMHSRNPIQEEKHQRHQRTNHTTPHHTIFRFRQDFYAVFFLLFSVGVGN